MERNAHLFRVVWQDIFREARLFLIQVDGQQFEMHRRPFLQCDQDIQQRKRILAAGKADHHAVTLIDHVEIGDGLRGVAFQPLGQFIIRISLFCSNHPRILRQICTILVT